MQYNSQWKKLNYKFRLKRRRCSWGDEVDKWRRFLDLHSQREGAGELFRRFSLAVGYRTFSVAYAAAEEERHLEVGTHKIRGKKLEMALLVQVWNGFWNTNLICSSSTLAAPLSSASGINALSLQPIQVIWRCALIKLLRWDNTFFWAADSLMLKNLQWQCKIDGWQEGDWKGQASGWPKENKGWHSPLCPIHSSLCHSQVYLPMKILSRTKW